MMNGKISESHASKIKGFSFTHYSLLIQNGLCVKFYPFLPKNNDEISLKSHHAQSLFQIST